MRRIGIVLVVVGVVMMALGTFAGCGALFSWNGRHPTAVHPLTVGTPLRQTFRAKAGRRYVIGVQVVFERAGLPEREGAVVVDARLPLTAQIEDASGVAVAKVVGWLDPSEQPTLLHGQAHMEGRRRAPGAPPPELTAERLIGPYAAPADGEVAFEIDLGPDRVASTPIKEARAVVYDDALPTSISRALAAAASGAAVFTAGVAVLVVNFFRVRRGGTRRRHFV